MDAAASRCFPRWLSRPGRRLVRGLAKGLLVVLAGTMVHPLLHAAPQTAPQTVPKPDRPCILVVLTDDQGVGDVSHGPHAGRIPTPNLDRLAREGLQFTDAHSSSSVCTPSRYSLLTGRYAWRTPLAQGVLGGLSPALIPGDRLTLASLLRPLGYRTAILGKWHLGLDWEVLDGKEVTRWGIETRDQVWNVDFSQPFRQGPTRLGFDHFLGISASLDMVPYTWLLQDRAATLPDRDASFPWSLDTGDRRTRTGPASPDFDAADVLGRLTDEAVRYLEHHAASGDDAPFFLYLALASPHTPILPSPAWQGRSGLNAYADFVMETDAQMGRLLDSLEATGLAGRTLVFFAADNGCSPEADLGRLESFGHRPGGPFRGHKADLFEGGHRVPFLARWPGRIPAGSRHDGLVCLQDILATCADLCGVPLPPDAGEDSFSLSRVLVQPDQPSPRPHAVHHSINGSFALRQGPWKLLLCPDSGGWSPPRPGSEAARHLPPFQLYHLEEDPGESRNLADSEAERVRELHAALSRIVDDGRSTPGPKQPNDRAISLPAP
jgi:arylsulfatase A